MLIQTEVGRAEVVAKQLAELPACCRRSTSPARTTSWCASAPTRLDDLQADGRAERAAGRRHHPHPDLPDRRRSAALEFGRGLRRPGDGPPRALLIAAIVGGRRRRRRGAGRRGAAAVARPARSRSRSRRCPRPQADSAECRALVEALPDQLGDYRRAPRGRARTRGRGGMAARSRWTSR